MESEPMLHDEPHEDAKLSWTLITHVLIVCFTGILLGFDLCIAGAILIPVQRSLELCYPCESYTDAGLADCTCGEKQLAISAVSIGAIFGSMFGGLLADFLGRRIALLASDVLFAVGGAAMAFATVQLKGIFFLGRALVGMALGIGGSASSAFLAEIAPASWRGRFLEANELSVCTGCLLSYGIAYGLGDDRWRVSIGLTAAVAVVQLLGVLFIQESPSWLETRGLRERAARSRAVLGAHGASEIEPAVPSGPLSFSGTLRALYAARRPLALALGVAAAHAATAANSVLYYSRDVLELAGLDDALLANTLVGVVKFSGVLAAFFGADRLGRRALLLVGTGIMVAGAAGLAGAFAQSSSPISSLALVSLLVFVLGWDVSWAGLMLALIAEVLPRDVRGAGTGVAYALYWLLSFVTGQFLESAFTSFGVAQTFGVIGGLCAIVLAWTWRYIPETANRALDEDSKLGDEVVEAENCAALGNARVMDGPVVGVDDERAEPRKHRQ